MIQKRLQLIIRQSALSLTMLSTIAASLVAGPALRASASTSSQAPATIQSPAAPLAGTYGSGASYTGGVCAGSPIILVQPDQAPKASGAPDGQFATLLGLNCQLTVNFPVPQTGNVNVYAVSTVALEIGRAHV